MLTLYSPDPVGDAVMNVGLGATFSRTGKLSSLMLSDLETGCPPAGLCAKAISPTTIARVTWLCEKDALTVSMTDAFSPCSCISGCRKSVLVRLLSECADRIDCASEPCAPSEGKGVRLAPPMGDGMCIEASGAGEVVRLTTRHKHSVSDISSTSVGIWLSRSCGLLSLLSCC